jgi:hypothetical protein
MSDLPNNVNDHGVLRMRIMVDWSPTAVTRYLLEGFLGCGRYKSDVQGTPSNTSAGTCRFSSERRSTTRFRESTLST